MAYALGPDISFYQDDNSTPEGVDFNKMRERSDFVVIRAGQNTWIDPDFKHNWKAAKEAGLPRGSYWFYDSRSEPKAQAKLWRDALGDDQGELPLFADFEESYDGPYAGWQKWYAFLEYVKKLMPDKEIVIYTGYYYWKENAPDPNLHPESLEYFHQYPLWIARYGTSEPLVPAPWDEGEWTFWQFTEHGDGAEFGVETAGIDLNYFNGTPEELRERFNIVDVPMAAVKYKVDLSLRTGPGRNYAAIANLVHDEIVERIDSDEDWLKVKRENGDEGWVSLEYLIREEEPLPDPDPDPDPDPEPIEEWAEVIPVSGLNVREGAGSQYSVVGVLTYKKVVKVLDYNDDRTWVKISDQSDDDELVGWCSAQYLLITDTPPEPDDDPDDDNDPNPDPDPDPDPDPEPTTWYRVTAYALNIRKGPSTTFDVIGKLHEDDVVERLEENDDGKWLKIRTAEGLFGWVYASYLEKTDEPSSDPHPAPDRNELGRHQVTARSLRVREEPNVSATVLGALSDDDLVWVDSVSDDGEWKHIVKDDLVGWCAAAYLTRYPPRTPINKKYFNKSVRYIREVYDSPRKMMVHLFVIDLKYKNLDFLVTPPDHNVDAAPLCARTTTEFLEEFNVQIAINGDGYREVYVPGLSCPEGSELVNPNSYAASRGNVYSQRWNTDRPIMYINKKNEVTYNKPKGAVYNAISGDRTLIAKGKPVAGLDNSTVQPRSAVGTNQNGRWMVMIVVDGRQPGYSEGCTLTELAEMMIKFGGIYNAINLDGGGSSALVIEENGKPKLLNSPIEEDLPGKERKVANHLGIQIK